MDDRTWYLALGALVASVVVVFLDAAIESFQIESAFFAVPGAVLSFLAVYASRHKNGNGDR